MSQTVPCSHCGLPAEPRPGSDDAFCCIGCETVYYALQDAGLEHFYTLQGGDGRPPTESEARQVDWSEHLHQLEDGTCELDMHLDGVHCAGCVWLVERMPRAVDGVVDARLNLSQAKLKVRWDNAATTPEQISQWLEQFGYIAQPRAQTNAKVSAAEKRMLTRVGVTWAIAANVMLIAIAFYSGLDTTDGQLWNVARWTSLVLTLLSLAFGAREFFARAWGSIVPWEGFRKLSVDVPISLGILGGFFYSAWATVTGVGELWFDSIAVLIAALLSARWLQMRGRRLASSAAERLLDLLPNVARRVTPEGIEEIPADQLQSGDVVEVLLGGVFPGDGLLLGDGSALVHRAVLTGESRPETVMAGNPVHAGETNMGHPVQVQISAAGEASRIGQILSWVQDAADHRAPITQLADSISGWFVLTVLAAAALTGAIWYFVSPEMALHHVVALLVISCPCALGMATPLALTVGLGKAAREGIFIKHDDVLQRMTDADIVVFDKTGTLTYGRPKIVDLGGVDADTLRLVAALEASSQHPFARAFDSWRDTTVVASSVEEHAGRGIVGIVNGHRLRVGKPGWIGDTQDAELTTIAIEVDGVVIGAVQLGDALRDESAGVLEGFRAMNVRPILLSGDTSGVVTSVATQLGIPAEDALAQQSPEQKLAFIQNLQSNGHVVAMVGDGVNDSAALQAADIGIAVHGGADLNLVAADVFLTRSDLNLVLRVFEGAHRVMRVVHRNLAGSATYNVLGISFAAMGWVSPLFAAVAMPISSVSVVVSSLLQNPFALPRESKTAPETELAAAE